MSEKRDPMALEQALEIAAIIVADPDGALWDFKKYGGPKEIAATLTHWAPFIRAALESGAALTQETRYSNFKELEDAYRTATGRDK